MHDGRKAYQFQEFSQTSEENILCLGSSRKQPVIRWEKNMAWPGKLTLTDKALYFKVLLQTNSKNLCWREFSIALDPYIYIKSYIPYKNLCANKF